MEGPVEKEAFYFYLFGFFGVGLLCLVGQNHNSLNDEGMNEKLEA